MPSSKQSSLPRSRRPLTGSNEIEAMIARIAPAIAALLADGVPRSKAAIVAALIDQYPKDEVTRTLIRLAITDQVVEKGHRYTLPPATGSG